MQNKSDCCKMLRMFVWLPQVLLAVVTDSRGVSSIGAKHTGQQQQTFTWPCSATRSSAHTHTHTWRGGKGNSFQGPFTEWPDRRGNRITSSVEVNRWCVCNRQHMFQWAEAITTDGGWEGGRLWNI